MVWRVLLFAISMPLAGASIADLKALAVQLQAQRSHPPGWRGESPLLTKFKHELRDWVESSMSGDLPDPVQFATALKLALKEAGLLCAEGTCRADNNLGLIGSLDISSPTQDHRWLEVVTSVGIVCECDQSVYLYERLDGRWSRRLESEQNGYGKRHYRPQWVKGELSPPDSAGQRLFLTVGFNPACWSVWQEGYFRLFRIGPRIVTLLDWEQSMLNIGEDVNQKVRADEVLLEFGSTGIEAGFSRRHVLHFRVDGDRVIRVEPLALQPVDFVDEWLSQKWASIAEWTDPKLSKMHEALRRVGVDEYKFAQPCVSRPAEWQVGVDFKRVGDVYFLIQVGGDYRYRMLDVSPRRQSGCPGEGAIDPEKQSSLFPAAKSR